MKDLNQIVRHSILGISLLVETLQDNTSIIVNKGKRVKVSTDSLKAVDAIAQRPLPNYSVVGPGQ